MECHNLDGESCSSAWPAGEREFGFPAPTHTSNEYLTAWDAISDLPSPPEDCTPLPSDPLHRRTQLSPLNLERLRHIPPGGGMEDLPAHLRAACHRRGADHKLGIVMYMADWRPTDRRRRSLRASIASLEARFGHPHENRNITLREGARLQSFPDTF